MTSNSNFAFVNTGKPRDYTDRFIQNASDCQRAWDQAVSSGQFPSTTPSLTVVEEQHKDFPYGCQYSKVRGDSDPSKPETMKLRFNIMNTNKPCSGFAQCIIHKELN